MITTKERAKLRKLAQNMDPVVQIGKGGISDAVIESVGLVLEKRELIKIRLLKNSDVDTDEAMDTLCNGLNADPVQKIGNILVVYKLNPKNKKHVL